MPIGTSVVVDRNRFSELIAELRRAIPANVRTARSILERGEQAIDEAQREAARIVAAAERDAAGRVADAEVLRRARDEADHIEDAAQAIATRTVAAAEERAHTLVAEAEREAKQQRDEADAYAISLLEQLQRTLGSFLGNVRESRRSFPGSEG